MLQQLRNLRYVEKDSQVPSLSTKPPWPALACERFFSSNRTACNRVLEALSLRGLQLTYIRMLSRKHICSRKRVLEVEQGTTLFKMVEQCLRRVRVGVVMCFYF